MAEPTTGLTIIKRFPYRGNAMEEYSNHYWLTGTTPADATAWRTLFDALVTQEKTCYHGSMSVVRGYGYSDVSTDATAVWSVDLTVSPNTPVTGTLVAGTNNYAPGDAAVWCRWGLARMNSKGKRIFLRKYFHPALCQISPNQDLVASPQSTALLAFATKLDDGSFAAGRKITDTHGSAIVNHGASTYVTTRTLKRRGKRPPS